MDPDVPFRRCRSPFTVTVDLSHRPLPPVLLADEAEAVFDAVAVEVLDEDALGGCRRHVPLTSSFASPLSELPFDLLVWPLGIFPPLARELAEEPPESLRITKLAQGPASGCWLLEP